MRVHNVYCGVTLYYLPVPDFIPAHAFLALPYTMHMYNVQFLLQGPCTFYICISIANSNGLTEDLAAAQYEQYHTSQECEQIHIVSGICKAVMQVTDVCTDVYTCTYTFTQHHIFLPIKLKYI